MTSWKATYASMGHDCCEDRKHPCVTHLRIIRWNRRVEGFFRVGGKPAGAMNDIIEFHAAPTPWPRTTNHSSIPQQSFPCLCERGFPADFTIEAPASRTTSSTVCSIPLTMLSIRFLSQFYRPMIINPSNQIYNFLNLIFPTKLSTAVYSTVGGRIGSVLVGRQASFASPPAKPGSIGLHYTYTICVRNKRGG